MNKKTLNLPKKLNQLKSLVLACAFTFCAMTPTAHAAYTIDTIAGTGTYDTGGAATYYAAHITAFADSGTPSAFSVALAQPYAIVKDSTNNGLVFIDRDHSAIRRITASGIVSTILSGFNVNTTGSTSCPSPYIPQYLTIDPSTGNLYATDGQNVFCIPRSGGSYATPNILATWNSLSSTGTNSGHLGWNATPTYDANCWFNIGSDSGTPSSPSLDHPQGIAFAPLSGGVGPYLYVGGVNNILQIDLNTANVTGGHYAYREIVSGLNYPTGLALNASNTSLFVTDAPDGGQGGVIRHYAVPSISDTVASSGDIVAGKQDDPASANACSATSSGFSPSANIAVDSDGGLYIADSYNNLIRYVPALTSGSYTTGYIYTIAGGGGSTTSGIAATAAQLFSPTGLFVDSNKTIFITEGSSSTSGNNFIRRIAFPPAAISLASISAISALTVPYYSRVAFSGGGTAKLTADNSTNLYGGVFLSGTATVELNSVSALGTGTSSTNTLTLGTGTGLQAGSSLASTSSNPSIIPVPIKYAGSVIIDTADDTRTAHSLETAAITSTASGANMITVKGGGTYTPAGAYTTGGTDVLAVVDLGTTLSLTNPSHAPANVRLGVGTILSLGCDLSSTSLVID